MSLSYSSASAPESSDSLPETSRPPETTKPGDGKSRWWQRPNRSSDETRVDFGKQTEEAMVESLLDLAQDSLERCGLRSSDFRLQLIRRGLGLEGPMLLVEVHHPQHMPWDLASHMEQYLVGRIRRRSGFSLARIVFTPVRLEGINQEDMRAGVRSAWTRLRTSQRLPVS